MRLLISLAFHFKLLGRTRAGYSSKSLEGGRRELPLTDLFKPNMKFAPTQPIINGNYLRNRASFDRIINDTPARASRWTRFVAFIVRLVKP